MTKKNTILKVVAILVMIVLSLVVLTGCGKKEENTNTENTNVENTNTQNEVVENTNVENTVVEPTPEETKKEISRGKWNDNVYTSEFAELTFKLPEGWTRSTDKEIAAMMQLGATMLEDEGKYNAEIAKLTSVYDMLAKSADQTSNIQVMMEKVPMQANEYAETLKKNLASLEQLSYNIGETTETTIGGNTYKAVSATVEVSGMKMEQSYYVRNEGDYIVAIIVTASGDTKVSDIMSNFQ